MASEDYRRLYREIGYHLGQGLFLPCTDEVKRISDICRLRAFEIFTIFDVGANIGEWGEAAKYSFPTAQIYCFEPNQSTFSTLKDRLADFTGVSYFNYALGNTCALGSMKSAGLNDPSAQFIVGSGNIEIKKIDCLIGDFAFPIPDILKIDAEGMDFQVLLGGFNHLSSIKIIQFEISPATFQKSTLKDFFCLLQETHLIFIITKNEFLQINYNVAEENYLGSSYFAVRK